MLEGRFGAFIMAAGAVGEFLPIVAVAIFLSAKAGVLLVAAPAKKAPSTTLTPHTG